MDLTITINMSQVAIVAALVCMVVAVTVIATTIRHNRHIAKLLTPPK
jgi:hypothetical protein